MQMTLVLIACSEGAGTDGSIVKGIGADSIDADEVSVEGAVGDGPGGPDD